MAVVKAAAYILAHAPDLVRYGSKPWREIAQNPALGERLRSHLRPFEAAAAYPPNQVFVGNLRPDALHEVPEPWYAHPVPEAGPHGRFGGLLPQPALYRALKRADQFDLIGLDTRWLADLPGGEGVRGWPADRIAQAVAAEQALPLYDGPQQVGCIRPAHEQDESLTAQVLLENFAAKATGAFALEALLAQTGLEPAAVEYILSCSEEAVGDRYNRGGGNLAKAIGELTGCGRATGSDVKAFCAAPIYALVHAAALVEARVFQRIAVVGGGSLAKLGMKFLGHLDRGMPVLEDVLGGMAFLVAPDDGQAPRIRLDAVGKHDIAAGSAPQAIMEALVARPLEQLGMKLCDVGKYAAELHNPEVTVPSGSGNVPRTNYRMIAALAVLRREIGPRDMEDFIRARGMPGYAPTQGHIPAGVPFVGHALAMMAAGELDRAMFIAKGSLFLGRMTQLSDGLSFLLERP